MIKLSWNEIRHNAIQFANTFQTASNENAEAQTFWNEFFQVFGLDRKLLATFEEPVKSLKNTQKRIDLFWKGVLLAEHKSAGESLDKAHSQAFDYIQDLATQHRDHEIPRYVVLSDFQRFVLFDLNPDRDPEEKHAQPYERWEFDLPDLHKHVRQFAFLLGQQNVKFRVEDDANLIAARLMTDLHDAFEDAGYPTHELERLLVRILFCLFADDTGIFEINQFENYIRNVTREDGSDLGMHLDALFYILDTPYEQRQKGLDEDRAAFPYVNGELFAGRLSPAAATRDMRNRLLAASAFNWGAISPAVFGSLFQGIMEPKERRQIGAHYTSERDILKVIRPLFLDALGEEFRAIKAKRQKNVRDADLIVFQNKLASLNFLDPACGCGNFLVIAYREIRRLELEVIKLRHLSGKAVQQQELPVGEVAKLSKVDVNQFYGIEIGEWPARIAETALWLTDHQMNNDLSLLFSNRFMRIPLKESPHIQCANALRFDWNDLLPAEKCNYVFGNPPFIGAKFQIKEQRAEVKLIAGSGSGTGLLDYVTLWYFKAADYIQNEDQRCAFVSTNSISQGEQVGVLWTKLFTKGMKLHFAHRTFSWQSEAKGKAHVHVVIIGFGRGDVSPKRLFDYDDIKGEPTENIVTNINPYLIEGDDFTILNRSKPICSVPEIGIGNKPIDGGHYLFTEEEKEEFLRQEPVAEKYFRPWIGSREFINGFQRWCLWLGDAPASDLRQMPLATARIDAVRKVRLASGSIPTQKLANTPRRFHVENFPEGPFLVLPEVSSERRPYIPIGYLEPPTICSNLVKLMPNATPYHFGILTSTMHMAWVRQICGRLKSDYRYSAKLVYNNFPWPSTPSEAQRAKVAQCAQAVLDARKKHLDQGSTLADLYDPLYMPPELLKAHHALDRAVDKCYRPKGFQTERERVEFLFERYQALTAPLAGE